MNDAYSSANSSQAEEKDLSQVCLQIGSHWMEFHEIRYLKFFENLWRNSSLIKI